MAHNRRLPHLSAIDPADVVPPAADPNADRGPRSLVDIPGTRAFAERQKAELHQGFIRNVADGFMADTGIATLERKLSDEGYLGLFGFRGGDDGYDKDAFAKKADPRLDRQQIEDILSENNLPAAMRRHRRFVDELNLRHRMSAQAPGAGLAHMLGSLADVDLLLMPIAGQALGAARLAARTVKLGQRAGLTFKASEQVANLAIGASAGLQAGTVVAGALLATKETAEWEEAAMIMIGSTVLSGVIGVATRQGKTLHAIAAEKEFLDRVARDDPNLTDDLDVESLMRTDGAVDPNDPNLFTMGGDEALGKDSASAFDDPDAGATVIGGNVPKGVGAEASGAPGRPKRVLNDPNGPIPEDQATWIDTADKWRDETNFNEKKEQDAQSLWTKLSLSKIGGFSVADFNKLYTSKSAVLNFMGGVIFESASGLSRGRATASILNEMYHRRIQSAIGANIDPLINKWAQDTQQTWLGSGWSHSAKGRKAFYREVMLELNDRAMGRTGKRGKHIDEAAARYESAGSEALDVAVGKTGQHPIDGMHQGLARKGYNPYRWDGASIQKMLTKGVTRREIEDALAKGYRAAGMAAGKDADAVSKAVVERALMRDADMDSSVMTLLSGDGREFMSASLRNSGLSETDIESLMARLVGSAEDRAKEGFAKSRNEIDMNIVIENARGEDIRLVDMLEQDMERTWQRYSRQISGAAALARKGITNKAARKTLIKAAQAEQRALGEKVMEFDLLDAMLSHFNAGPTHGFSGGQINKGLNIYVATAKRIANLGLLEKLGITQLGETGAIIAQVGVKNWYTRGPMALWDKQMRESNSALLKDVSYIIGDIGRDQRYFGEWLDLDDVSNDHKATWINTVSGLASNAAYVQSYTSAFNHVRKFQQQMTVLGMVDKVMRTIKEGDFETMLRRFESDFGLGREELLQIENMVNSGLIEFHDRGFVNSLNMDKWDPDLAETFGAAMVRSMNQTVQKSLAGEQDAWMHSGWGSVMTHLLTFPMAAFQKQFIRNGRHMDLQALAAMSFGLATAMVAINIRDAVDGRERSQEDRALAAFGYNNMTGWIPMVFDPAMTILGLDDQRINPFGPYASVIPPVFSQADNLRRAGGAVLSMLRGEKTTYQDRQAWKAVPFMGTYFVSRLWDKPKKPTEADDNFATMSDAEFDAGQRPQNVTAPIRPDQTKPDPAPAPVTLTRNENARNREALDAFIANVVAE